MLNKLKLLLKKYDDMSLVAKATIWFTLSNFFNMGVSMLTTPIVSRLLSTTEYGVISVYHTWESILNIVVTLYLFCGIQEVSIAKNSDDQDQVTGSLMSLSLILVTIAFIISAIFPNTISNILNLDYRYIALMLVDIAACAVMQFWFTHKRFNYAYKTFTIVTSIRCVLRAILGIVLILMMPGDKVFGRLFGLAIPDFIFGIVIFFVIIRKTRFKDINKYWMRAIKFNVILIPHYLSGVLLSSSDRIMISSMIGDDKAGIYSMMYSCASIVGMFYSSASSAIAPFFLSSIKNKNYEGLNNKVIQAIIVTVCCSMVGIIVAPEILQFFAPSEYHEGLILIPILMFGMYLNFFYLLFSNFAFYYEKKYFITIATLVSAFINIVLNYIFIPIYGYQVAAWTTGIGYLFLATINYFIYRKLVDEKIFNMKKIISIIGIFAICTVVAIALYPYFILRFILIIIALIFTYKNRTRIISVFR